jgi:putative phage-type endonuclease
MSIEWLEERRKHIGSSDIARLLGIAPDSWGGPYRVWLDKTTAVEDNDESLGDLGYWGHRLEPLIAERYAEEHSVDVSRFADDYVTPWVATGFPHCAATPDYYAHSSETLRHPSEVILIECKNVSGWMADGWGPSGSEADGNVPPHYLAQVRWQLGCTGARGAVIAALIGGNDWRWYSVERDEEWFRASAELADAWFADHVLTGQAPPPDQRSDIVVGAPAEQGLILVADDELDAVLDERRAYKLRERLAVQHGKRLDTLIVSAMGNDFHQVNRRDGTVAATYRVSKSGSRRLSIKV